MPIETETIHKILAELGARILRISQRGEEPTDADDIRKMYDALREEVDGNLYWRKRIEILGEILFALPIFSSEVHKRSSRTGYQAVIEMLEHWR